MTRGIKIDAQIYRKHNRWHLDISAPDWLIREIADQYHAGGKWGVSSYGGEIPGDTLGMTLVMMPKEAEAPNADH